MSTTSRYVVGIDLGTTHSVMAYLDTSQLGEEGPPPVPVLFEVPQVVLPGQVEARPLLPSFLYLAAATDFPARSLQLPWTREDRTWTVGELARQHGGSVPMRLVSSAKSWLAYDGVDRTAPILPFAAPSDGPDAVPKVSPVDASARYLEHLKDAWNHQMPGFPLHEQEVLITVPASFDQVARELTVRAAHQAGLHKVTLLEEPQAAFYAWLGRHPRSWRDLLHVGDVVLVCDVGGGTTDFSLISVADQAGNLTIERIAVGDHILLGGDNMDLMLAMSVGKRLEREGHKLEAWQRRQLLHSCRFAKEELLGTDRQKELAPVVILGRGSKVIGGSIKTQLSRGDVEKFLLDGFFPQVESAARPTAARRMGLQEIGLPFASDPAVTRHLAKFLGDHRLPTALLFNGGVMKGTPLRKRVEQVVSSWAGQPVRALTGADYDHSVALGAAYYGLVRRGHGLRIRGGTARSYYIGVEAAMPAVPGMDPVLHALCVAPRGMEEGTTAEVPGREFGLFVGQPVEFRFLSSSTRRGDRVGDFIEEPSAEHGIEELASVETVLAFGEGAMSGSQIPVRLTSHVSEVGVLELWCVSRDGQKRWKLEYNIRERTGSVDGGELLEESLAPELGDGS
ncbi:MAG: Hsp70 family protein [Myxococcales bacterium]|nr:Hsp70 family protein [Myxococcales bacterium]